MFQTRPSVEGDVDWLARNLRQADLNEIAAGGDDSPAAVLRQGLEQSDPCVSIFDDADPHQRPVAMFGVVPTPVPFIGFIWLLGSDQLSTQKSRFLRQCPPWVDRFHERFPVLMNYVDKRNTLHLSWLRWLGFRFTREITTEKGFPFIEFVRTANVQPPRSRRVRD